MLPCYLTIKRFGEMETIIQKSRFIAHVSRAETEEEALEFIQKIKKQHSQATHNCSAYMIGENDQIQKANDDGEPSGTAGIPILEVLKKRKLKDTVVVVTRYFGGIKLGAGGLIRAYGKTASAGIESAGIVKRQLMRVIHTKSDYTWLGKLENEIRSSHFILREIKYLETIEILTLVEEGQDQAFKEWITEMTNGQSEFEQGELLYLETEIQ
ncbi:YigZ family protein [Bacillus infantis]|uniref:YigZ family protein n=1 Tax=Bacillus infantis TaxID=324767 RepID=UPI003CE9321C